MRNLFTCLLSLFLILAFTGQSFVQQTQASSAASSTSASPVPRLIKFSGTLLDHQGQPRKDPVGVTFSLYAQQSGDAPAGWKRRRAGDRRMKKNHGAKWCILV